MTDTVTWAPFELEQRQSEWEHTVEINLADSGVAPVTLAEFGDLGELGGHELHYPQVNGTRALRERIAALYPHCSPDQVLVTVGAAEANSLVAQTLLRPGDRAVVMAPGYQQIRGLAGTILTDDELAAVVAAADRSGAWLHSDEVYRGSELDGPEAPTAWGRHERVLAVGSLSKSYGLSGLRVGWIAGCCVPPTRSPPPPRSGSRPPCSSPPASTSAPTPPPPQPRPQPGPHRRRPGPHRRGPHPPLTSSRSHGTGPKRVCAVPAGTKPTAV